MEINGFNIEPIEGEAGVHDVSFSPTSVNESIDKVVEIDAVAGDKTARVTLIHEGMREVFNVAEGPFMVAEGTFNVLKEIKEDPITYGVYIQDTTGKLWTTDVWDGSATPNGVAVIDESCAFLVSLDSTSSNITMQSSGTSTHPNLTKYTTTEAAITDFNGIANTEEIVAVYGNTTSEAAGYCANYTFPDGHNGHLGSAGEWNVLAKYHNDVASALSACGATALSSNTQYWTSTMISIVGRYSEFWQASLNDGVLTLSASADTNSRRVRVFGTLTM